MRQIRFCSHAQQKFEILRQHGFPVDRKQIIETLKRPDKIERGFNNKWIAQKGITKEHVLRVVFEKKGRITTVITFYPGRRSYYES